MVKSTFTLQETVESFGQAKRTAFKEAYARLLAPVGTDAEGSITADMVALTVSGGSIEVETRVNVYMRSMLDEVKTKVDTLTPSAASSALGVTVEGVTKAEEETIGFTDADDGEDDGASGGGGGTTDGAAGMPVWLIAVVAGVGGLVVIFVAIITIWCCMKKKKKKSNATAPAAPPQGVPAAVAAVPQQAPPVAMGMPVEAERQPAQGGNRYDAMTGAELPKFDPQTGKQNWW